MRMVEISYRLIVIGLLVLNFIVMIIILISMFKNISDLGKEKLKGTNFITFLFKVKVYLETNEEILTERGYAYYRVGMFLGLLNVILVALLVSVS